MNRIFTAAVFFCCIFFTVCCHFAGWPSEQKKPVEPVYEVPDLSDHEFEPQPGQREYCDSCTKVEDQYQSKRLAYFMELVYRPAMKNRKLSPGNRAFLKALRRSLEKENATADFIRPVFRLEDTVGIFSDFSPVSDTIHPFAFSSTSYRVYYRGSTTAGSYAIRQSDPIYPGCNSFRRELLYTTNATDTLQPFFCTTYDLSLAAKRDTTFDRLLKMRNDCQGNCYWLCGPAELQYGFAQLENVPRLWFTTSLDNDFRPVRGLYVDIDGKFALELWSYELDLSSCSCI